MPPKLDLRNREFGRLRAISEAGKDKWGCYFWNCLCDPALGGCGSTTVVVSSSLVTGNTISCGCFRKESVSDRCKGKSLAESHRRKVSVNHACMVGENNPFFGKTHSKESRLKIAESKKDKNITDEERENKRFTLDGVLWRKTIFERDNFTCQCCGIKGGRLAAHHLASYKSNKVLRTELSNGVTVCNGNKDSCHNRFHKAYGRKNNTKDQFERFVKGFV